MKQNNIMKYNNNRMLDKYYNKETHTLRLPYNFKSLLKDLPLGTKIIIFEENRKNQQFSEFNQKVNNLPSILTHGNIWMDI